jgi:dTDP-4-dehydrorhamnose reductase
MSKPEECARQVQDSWKANVEATAILASLCADNGIKLVFTSTDLVFDGKRGHYAEEDGLNPIMHYGEHKAEAEGRVLSLCPGSAVCRMPLMYGQPSPGGQSFIQGFIARLQQGKTLSLFYDEWRSVLQAADAAMGLLWAAAHVQGIVHLGGPEPLSRYAFGQLLVDAFGFDPALIQSCSQESMVFSAPRPSNCSLNSMFANSLGFKPAKADIALRQLAQGNPMAVAS